MLPLTPANRLLLVALVFSAPQVLAEVFKCTTADGRTSYSSTPCTAPGAKEVVVPIVPAPLATTEPKRDWAAENAAANARVQASEAAAAEARATVAAQKASSPAKTAEQIQESCLANRGVDCSSSKEIARRQAEDTTLSSEDAAAMHRAAAGRRQNEGRSAEAMPPPPDKKAAK